jgi:hypothetical protein
MGFRVTDTTCRLLSAVVACLVLARAVEGQETTTLSGRVTDRSTGKPVRNAQIILLSDSRSVTSDSLGKYLFNAIPPGSWQLIIRAANFPAQQIVVTLELGQHADRPILLDSTAFGRLAAAQSLPSVDVTARAPEPNYRLAAFERRRVNGLGQYLTEDQILKSGAYTVADAVKAMRGVNYECGGGAGCFIRMARAPMHCLPEFIVDDQTMNDFGPSTPIRDVIAIELYTGPTELPGEYSGRNGGCGVVVIWTKSGPPRKRR